MKETIEFKKEIILKTAVAEMVEINLTHEYKILDDVVEGDFYVTGEYKMTEASVKTEEFYYKIPFAIALSERIKKESVNLIIEDFNYEINKDVLMLKMSLGMNYEEIVEENETKEQEEIEEIIENEIIDGSSLEETIKEEINQNEFEEETKENEELIKEQEEIEEQIESITQKFNMPDGYVTYKIHIVKSEETYETIAMKYDVTVEDLQEYNDIEILSIGDKVIIPYVKNE